MSSKDYRIIKIPSTNESINVIEKFIDDICDYYNVNSIYYGNILMAITEAFNNACIHGNKNDKNKSVFINFEYKENLLSFTITDEGEGFNLKNIPDATDPNYVGNIQKGIYLMSILSDEIKYNNIGNSVELKFKLSPIDEEKYKNRLAQLQSKISDFQRNK